MLFDTPSFFHLGSPKAISQGHSYSLEEASLHAVLYALRHVLQVVGEDAVAQVVEQVQA